MKKYIRTKNGEIYDTESYAYTWTTQKEIGLGISTNENLLIPKSLIEKQADTLDELCDCYLEDCERGIPAIITKTMWVDFHMEKALRKYTTFYACIIKRDDKGVHINPVAKLNEKGDFELL